jgi:hypothetical protein
MVLGEKEVIHVVALVEEGGMRTELCTRKVNYAQHNIDGDDLGNHG